MPIFDTKSCGCTSPDLIVEVPEKKHVGARAWGGVGALAWGGVGARAWGGLGARAC